VLRPGGELIVLTRISAMPACAVSSKQRLQPVVRPLGFSDSAEFAWSRYAKWLAGSREWSWSSAAWSPPLGTSRLIRFAKRGRSCPPSRAAGVRQACVVKRNMSL